MDDREREGFFNEEKSLKSDKKLIRAKFVRENIAQIEKRSNISSLMKFVHNRSHERVIYKRKIFQQAFSNNLGSIYVSNTGGLLEWNRLRQILVLPQINLFIIFLIMLDWFIGVIELLSDLAEEKYKFFGKIEDIAEYVSITILCLFLVEIILRLILLPKIFFTSCLEIFDAVIVLVSLVVESIFLNKRDYSGIGTILLLFRFWRFIRIINRIIIAVEKQLIEEVAQFKQEILDLFEENEKLKSDLRGLIYANLINFNMGVKSAKLNKE